MQDFGVARAKMVESQVRPNGITDSRLIDAMASIAREDFVPEDRRSVAYMDADLPVAAGDRASPPRYLMEPMVFARLVQLAEIGPADRVLHIGCTTGYGTAVLARLAQSVVAIDENPELVACAAATLREEGAANVQVQAGKHADGDPAHGPYDAILIEGRVPAVPPQLFDQLKEGGRLVAVVGTSEPARAMFYRRNGAIGSRAAFDASVQQLPGIVGPRPGFVF